MEASTRTDTPTEDLTVRARIRDVALRLFAGHGVAGTSLRGVAEAAGVSTGAVQHHFGSKAGLRQACDDHAIGVLLEQARGAMSGPQPQFPAAMFAVTAPSTRYLARALVDGSPAAAALFDAGTDLAESWLSTSWPDRFPERSERVRNAAAVMAGMHLGTVVLHEHLSRRMGVDVLAPEHAHRIGAGMADVYPAVASSVGDTGSPEDHDGS
jgi:TetR/AcrR family transcriptional regulator, regulator of cefoperazone and chloramphenicol sensitivity